MKSSLVILALLPLCLAAKRDVYGPPLASECTATSAVSIVLVVRDTTEVQRMYTASSTDGAQVRAFTTTGPDGRKVLVLPPLRGQDDAETMRVWGHELAHVVCGSFHGTGAAY